MKSDGPVAIIGGGFSGTILAAQLARRGIRAILIEARAKWGAEWLIRPRKRPSSQCPRRRDERLGRRAGSFRYSVRGRSGDRRGFAQRRQFGAYLGKILDEAVASGMTQPIRASAIAAARWMPAGRSRSMMVRRSKPRL